MTCNDVIKKKRRQLNQEGQKKRIYKMNRNKNSIFKIQNRSVFDLMWQNQYNSVRYICILNVYLPFCICILNVYLPGVTTHLVASQALAETLIPVASLEFCTLERQGRWKTKCVHLVSKQTWQFLKLAIVQKRFFLLILAVKLLCMILHWCTDFEIQDFFQTLVR